MAADSIGGITGEHVDEQDAQAAFWRKPVPANRPRELVLIICFVLLLLMFSVTALVSRLYHRKIHSLADQWYAQGDAAFHAGDAKTAILDYRNALVYSPNNSVFQLHLAQALVSAARFEEARSYLINLLAESPGITQFECAYEDTYRNQISNADRQTTWSRRLAGGTFAFASINIDRSRYPLHPPNVRS